MNVQQSGSPSPYRAKTEESEDTKPNPASLGGHVLAPCEPGTSGLFSAETSESGNRKRKRKVAGMEGSSGVTAETRVKTEPPEDQQPSASNIAMITSPVLSELAPFYRCRKTKNSFRTSIPYDEARVTEKLKKRVLKNIKKVQKEIRELKQKSAASITLAKKERQLQALNDMKARYDATLPGPGSETGGSK